MKRTLIGLLICWTVTVVAHAQTAPPMPPPLIPFSGLMMDATGQPLTGSVSAIFALYEGSSGGVPLWVEVQTVQPDQAGQYVVLLGATTSLPVDLFASGLARWLGVQPEGHAEQLRTQFVSVAYALKASDADTLGGQPLSNFVLAGDKSSSALKGSGDADGLVAGSQTYNEILQVQPTMGSAGQVLQVDLTNVASGSNAVFVTAPNGWSGNVFKGNLNSVETFRIGHDGSAGFGGFVGFGATTGATAALHLQAGTALLAPTSGGAGQGLQISLGGMPNGSNAFFADAPTGWTGNIFKSNLAGAEVWAIAHDGGAWFSGLGIGAANPGANDLHVAGDVTVGGNIAAKYQDVAEWVDAREPIDDGTVVVIDLSEFNHVEASNEAYDTRVGGAVSAQPGLILGDPGEGRVLVAQSGRVRVKVDATYGAIQPGDILVTSPTAGRAMRSEPMLVGDAGFHRPGTVLGKALEPLESGLGEILVLLTLQ